MFIDTINVMEKEMHNIVYLLHHTNVWNKIYKSFILILIILDFIEYLKGA